MWPQSVRHYCGYLCIRRKCEKEACVRKWKKPRDTYQTQINRMEQIGFLWTYFKDASSDLLFYCRARTRTTLLRARACVYILHSIPYAIKWPKYTVLITGYDFLCSEMKRTQTMWHKHMYIIAWIYCVDKFLNCICCSHSFSLPFLISFILYRYRPAHPTEYTNLDASRFR